MQGLKLVAVVLAMALAGSGSTSHAIFAAPVESQDNWGSIAMRARPGEEIVVEVNSITEVTGTFVRLDGNELVLWVGGAEKRLEQGEIRAVTRVRTTRNRRGILIGAIAGAAVGFLSISDEEDFSPRGRLVFASLGAGAGAAIGTAFSGRRTSKEIIYRAQIGPEDLGVRLGSRARCNDSAAGKSDGAMIDRTSSRVSIVDPIAHAILSSFAAGPSGEIRACR